MTDVEMIAAYTKLFKGRGDTIGPFEDHLRSTHQYEWMDVHPHGDHVSWGCIDIDGKNFRLADEWDWPAMLDLAYEITVVLDHKDVFAHIEQTRNGYRLWVFPAAGIVPAAFMRRALMVACKACGYDPKEVNPKQEEIGNYGRLPYYGALSDVLHPGWPAPELRPSEIWQQPDGFFIDDHGKQLGLLRFLDTVQLTGTDALEAASQ